MRRIAALFTSFFFIILSSQYVIYNAPFYYSADSDKMRIAQSAQEVVNRLLFDALALGNQGEASETARNAQGPKFANLKQGLHGKELSSAAVGRSFDAVAADKWIFRNPPPVSAAFSPMVNDGDPRAP